MKQKQVETFYDYYDGIADLLYRNYKVPYLEGMNEAFRLLLDDAVDGSYTQEDVSAMRDFKEAITSISFEREEVRKSVQLGVLKAYKHTISSNSLITPDTIGIFIAYLIKKLYQDKVFSTILDALVGSGNLLYTVANQLDQPLELFGLDNDIIQCNLARNVGDLLEYDVNIYFQDTLTFYHTGFDVVVADMPITDETPYPPYLILNHHIETVAPGGYLFAVIENDFFDQEGSDTFRQEIASKGQIVGLIQLPEDLFTSHPKSIFILRRSAPTQRPLEGFLLVDLPSFRHEEGSSKLT